MTENRRIVLNIAATYGRSLFAMACGIFGGRWALMALGEVDYGLQGLVGGLTAFIAFFNGILAAAVGRFYALSVGKARTDAAAGIEESRRWFSIALVIHTVVPGILLIVGWPIGEWAIRNFLTIPPDRVNACLWVFRFSCVGCFLGMVSVPFNAFYGAKQLIAELTVYGFATTTLNIAMLYYMVTHPADWLVKYALWLTLLGIVPSLIITGRAIRLFPECRFRFGYCRDWPRFRKLFSYAFWQFFGAFALLLRTDGIAVLVNRYFGPVLNASLSVARNAGGKADELASSMLGAFTPAVTAAYGAGDRKRAFLLADNMGKFGVAASLVFAIPLAVEIDYVMRLWLVNPPRFASAFCIMVMVQRVVNKLTKGHALLIQADGRIGLYQFTVSVFAGISVLAAWALFGAGRGPLSLCVPLIGFFVAYAGVRPFFAAWLTGCPIIPWVRGSLAPLLGLTALTAGAGYLLRLVLDEGIVRLVVSAVLCEVVLLPLVWSFLLDEGDRLKIRNRIFRKSAGGGGTIAAKGA